MSENNHLAVFYSLFVAILIFCFAFPYTGNAQMHGLTIRKFEDLKKLEIVYNYPDFEHPRLQIYNDTLLTSLQNTLDVSSVTKFLTAGHHDSTKEWDDTSFKGGLYQKKIIESLIQNDYIVSLAMFHDENDFVYGDFKYDLMLWKDRPKGYELVAIYPEAIGGCLFCGANFTSFSGDTVQVEYKGSSLGEEWGGRATFIVQDVSLFFYKEEMFRTFLPFRKYGNPVQNAHSESIKELYFDHNHNIIKKRLYYDATLPNGEPVTLHAISDSLKLYRVTLEFPEPDPPYVKTVFVGNVPLKVGPIQGNMIPVFWDNQWYVTYRKYLIVS